VESKSSMIQIAEAARPDAAAIAHLLEQLGYPASETETLRRIECYQQPGYKLWVAKDENKTVGFIALHVYQAFHWEKPYGKIVAFCVDDRARGKGVGSMLLTKAEKYFAESGCVKIEVSSNKRRAATHAYYLNRGYEETSRYFVKIIKP
jgi:GNAT superfamily N-acetyltransferase